MVEVFLFLILKILKLQPQNMSLHWEILSSLTFTIPIQLDALNLITNRVICLVVITVEKCLSGMLVSLDAKYVAML